MIKIDSELKQVGVVGKLKEFRATGKNIITIDLDTKNKEDVNLLNYLVRYSKKSKQEIKFGHH